MAYAPIYSAALLHCKFAAGRIQCVQLAHVSDRHLITNLIVCVMHKQPQLEDQSAPFISMSVIHILVDDDMISLICFEAQRFWCFRMFFFLNY